jgi:hypothetical protein
LGIFKRNFYSSRLVSRRLLWEEIQAPRCAACCAVKREGGHLRGNAPPWLLASTRSAAAAVVAVARKAVDSHQRRDLVALAADEAGRAAIDPSGATAATPAVAGVAAARRVAAAVREHLEIAPEDVAAAMGDGRVPAAASLMRVHKKCADWLRARVSKQAAEKGGAAADGGSGGDHAPTGPGWGAQLHEAALLAAAEEAAGRSEFKEPKPRRSRPAGPGDQG